MTILTDRRASELFLSQLRHPDVPTWLASPEFKHNPAAQRTLEHLAQEPEFAAALPYLLTALDSPASPDRALINFDRFISNSTDPPALFRQLAHHPRTLEILITLFAGSQFLTEVLLRHPDYFHQLKNYKHLARPKSAEQLQEEARMRGQEDTKEASSPAARRLPASSSPCLLASP